MSLGATRTLGAVQPRYNFKLYPLGSLVGIRFYQFILTPLTGGPERSFGLRSQESEDSRFTVGSAGPSRGAGRAASTRPQSASSIPVRSTVRRPSGACHASPPLRITTHSHSCRRLALECLATGPAFVLSGFGIREA